MIVDNTRSHYEVRFEDIDPDTGEASQDKLVAIVPELQAAGTMVNALNLADEEPNRRYYFIPKVVDSGMAEYIIP
jgi:hypothetical protein